MHTLATYILEKFPEATIVRTWPQHLEIKQHLLATLDHQWIKSYGPEAREQWLREYQLQQDFRELNHPLWTSPKILEIIEDEYLTVVMEDAGMGIDFKLQTAEALITLYKSYREVFEEFAARTSATDIDVFARQTTKVSGRLEMGKKHIEVDAPHILARLAELQARVTPELEYAFGRFWSGHVYRREGQHVLIDRDNVGYDLKGRELTGIMRSNMMLTVEAFASYEERKERLDYRVDLIQVELGNQDLTHLVVYEKLVGTVYADVSGGRFGPQALDWNKRALATYL